MQDTSVQDKDTSVKDKDTSVQDKDTSVQDKDTSVQDKDTSVQDKDTSVQDKDTSVQTRTPEGCLDLGACSCDRLSHRRRLIFSARAKQRLLAYHRPLPPQFEMRPLAVFVAAACTFAPTT